MYLARTYETNYLINVVEYVTIIDKESFVANEESIKMILHNLAFDYLFDDIGYTLKNYCNWGSRFSVDGDGSDDMVILDYGYLYPLIGQNRKELFRCPNCGGQLQWNSNYTELVCTGNDKQRCAARFSPLDIRRNMRLDFENMEEKMMASFNDLQKPNLNKIEQSLNNITKKGDKS